MFVKKCKISLPAKDQLSSERCRTVGPQVQILNGSSILNWLLQGIETNSLSYDKKTHFVISLSPWRFKTEYFDDPKYLDR